MDFLKNPVNVLIITVGVLLVVAMLLAFIRHGGRMRIGKGGTVEVGEDAPKNTCADFQSEHTTLLNDLKSAVLEIKQALQGLNAMQIAEVSALDVLLGWAEGEKINDQFTNARKGLNIAEGYKKAKEDMEVS